MPPSNGGIPAPLNIILVSVNASPSFYTFDTTNFNDSEEASFYFWKVEDILAGRTPTCNKVIVSYTDLGLVTATFTLSGTNDLGEVVSESSVEILGNQVATGRMLTKILGIPALTAQNLQLTVNRAANAGPLSIVKVRIEGEVENTSYS